MYITRNNVSHIKETFREHGFTVLAEEPNDALIGRQLDAVVKEMYPNDPEGKAMVDAIRMEFGRAPLYHAADWVYRPPLED